MPYDHNIPPSRLVNIIGKRYGRLTVVEYAGSSRWICRCDCGGTSNAKTDALNNGNVRSCGCLRREMTIARNQTHQMSGTRVYNAWLDIRRRCTDESRPDWMNYGGRGIRVCERWQSFDNFYADMDDPPAGYSIDRIDVDGDYCPENCRWATRVQQQRNTRRNSLLTHNGETLCVAEWSERTGISRCIIRRRIDGGMSIAEALNAC